MNHSPHNLASVPMSLAWKPLLRYLGSRGLHLAVMPIPATHCGSSIVANYQPRLGQPRRSVRAARPWGVHSAQQTSPAPPGRPSGCAPNRAQGSGKSNDNRNDKSAGTIAPSSRNLLLHLPRFPEEQRQRHPPLGICNPQTPSAGDHRARHKKDAPHRANASSSGQDTEKKSAAFVDMNGPCR